MFKFLTHGDDVKIKKEIQGLKNLNKNSSPDISTRLKPVIIAVDGDDDKKTIREVVDNLNDRQEMVYQLVQERSANDIPTTYNDVAPLLKGIEDANRQARKTLTQLEKHKLIIGDLKVRNKVETKWYWINKSVQEP